MYEVKEGIPAPAEAGGRKRRWPWPTMEPGKYFDVPLTEFGRSDPLAARLELRRLRNRVYGSFYQWRDADYARNRLRLVLRVLWPARLIRVWMTDGRDSEARAIIEAQAANETPGPDMGRTVGEILRGRPDPAPPVVSAAPVQAPAPKPAAPAAPAVAIAEPEPGSEATDFGDW